MNLQYLAGRFSDLGVDDPVSIAEYIAGVIEAGTFEQAALEEALEPFISNLSALRAICQEIEVKYNEEKATVDIAKPTAVTDHIKSKWNVTETTATGSAN